MFYHQTTFANTTYSDFPSADELLPLPGNLIFSYLTFLERFNLVTPNNIKLALSTNAEGLSTLMKKGHYLMASDPKSAAERQHEWQMRQIVYLHGDPSPHTVSMREVLDRASKNKVFPERIVEITVRNTLRRIRVRRPSVSVLEGARQLIDFRHVQDMIDACELRPIYDWRSARYDKTYVSLLLTGYFPHVSYGAVKQYLFGNSMSCANQLQYYCKERGIYREPRKFTYRDIDEYLAFVKWSGNDPKEFLINQGEKLWYCYD